MKMMRNLILLLVAGLMFASCGGDMNADDEQQGNKTEYLKAGEHTVEEYANGSPRLIRTLEDVDGILVAVYEKEYWDDGNILKEGGLKNGKRHGIWKSFHRDGTLWSEGEFNEGVRQGVSIAYHPNGAKRYHGFFTNGLKSGVWKFYDENGEFLRDVSFDKAE